MKLFDLAMKLDDPEMQVTLIDSQSRRVAFNGTAYDLLDFSDLDYREVVRIRLLSNPTTLRVEIK